MRRLGLFLVFSNLLCAALARDTSNGINPETIKEIALCPAAASQIVVAGHNFTALRDQLWDFPKALETGGLENYIYRYSEELKKRGITLSVVPMPFVYNVYPEYFPPDFLTPKDQQRDVKAYNNMLDRFKSHGMTTVDTLNALLKSKGESDLYLPLDHHWTPSGASAIAHAVADSLPAELKTQLRTGKYSVDIGPDKTEWTTAYSSKIINACPELKLPKQSIYTVNLNDPDSSLLDDYPEDVVLFGSSFSNPNSGNDLNFGFDAFLSQIIGTRVINHALNGGDLVQSALLYFSSAVPRNPRLIVWEYYVISLNDPTVQAAEFRQLLPLLYGQSSDSVALKKTFDGGKTLVVDVNKELDQVSENQKVYIEFTSSELPRPLTVKIEYLNGTTEILAIERKFFLFPILFNDFKLELKSSGIKQISIFASGEIILKKGDFFLKIH